MIHSTNKILKSPEFFFNQEEAVRHDLRLLSWEISGVGDEFRDNRKKFFREIFQRDEKWILRYGGPDTRLEFAHPAVLIQAPSIFLIKSTINPDDLYNLINDADWRLVPFRENLIPPALVHGDHTRRITWLRFFNAAYILENHHMTGTMIYAENDTVKNNQYNLPGPVKDEGLYPILMRMLASFVRELPERSDRNSRNIEWLYTRLPNKKRNALRSEIELAQDDSQLMAFHGITRPDSNVASKLGSIAFLEKILGGLSKRVEFERNEIELLTEIKKLIFEFHDDFRSSNRHVELVGPVIIDRNPYRSEGVVKIVYPDYVDLINPGITDYPGRKVSEKNNFEHVRIPLYKYGRLVSKPELKADFIRELRLTKYMTIMDQFVQMVAPVKYVGTLNLLEGCIIAFLIALLILATVSARGCMQ